MAVLNIRESWLREMDDILSNRILIDMLAQEPSMTRTVRRGGHEILQGEGKKRERERERKSWREREANTHVSDRETHSLCVQSNIFVLCYVKK